MLLVTKHNIQKVEVGDYVYTENKWHRVLEQNHKLYPLPNFIVNDNIGLSVYTNQYNFNGPYPIYIASTDEEIMQAKLSCN